MSALRILPSLCTPCNSCGYQPVNLSIPALIQFYLPEIKNGSLTGAGLGLLIGGWLLFIEKQMRDFIKLDASKEEPPRNFYEINQSSDEIDNSPELAPAEPEEPMPGSTPLKLQYISRTFIYRKDRNSGRVFEDMEIRNCRFINSELSLTDRPELKSTVRNVKIVNCKESGCRVGCAIIENCLIDGLIIRDGFGFDGAVFKHVKFQGKIGWISFWPPTIQDPHKREAMERAHAEYYRKGNWALDISEARFDYCNIRGIPAALIRRDPQTQAVIKRGNALSGEWKKLDLPIEWATNIQDLLLYGEQNMVLVTPLCNPEYKIYLDGLKKLRDAGVAEPD